MLSDNRGKNRSIWYQLKRNKLSWWSGIILAGFYFTSLFAGFFAPYHFDDEKRSLSYAPPVKIHILDKNGRFHRPFVYKTGYRFNKFYRRRYKEDKSVRYPLKFFVKGSEYSVLGVFKSRLHLFGVNPPVRVYVWGADSRGRDIFSRIIYGSQISLTIGIVGVFISLVIGLFIGGISGYFGGKVDTLLMRTAEVLMAVPAFYLMLSLRSVFSYSMSSLQIYFVIVCIMSFIGWPGLARVIRGMAISLREREFVLAAKALGVRDVIIILRHIIPHTFSYVIVSVTLAIPGYILGESALSLLGLGIQDPYASWGNMLSDAMAVSQIQLHPWILIPGVFIFIAIMAFNLLGDGLRDAFDPHHQ